MLGTLISLLQLQSRAIEDGVDAPLGFTTVLTNLEVAE